MTKATTLRIKLLAWLKAGETLRAITLDDAVGHPTISRLKRRGMRPQGF